MSYVENKTNDIREQWRVDRACSEIVIQLVDIDIMRQSGILTHWWTRASVVESKYNINAQVERQQSTT